MKKIYKLLLASVAVVAVASCGGPKVQDTYAPEESGLNVMKLTDESTVSILGPMAYYSPVGANFAANIYAGSKKAKYIWSTVRVLDVSPDGTEIAYNAVVNKQSNVLIKKSALQGASTQRTFRNVGDFSWGSDGNLYYADATNTTYSQISSTNAHVGSLIKQLTSNNDDSSPVLTSDGKVLFFTRVDNSGPSIWSLDMETGALTSCARGYSPEPIPGENDKFLCVRNSPAGNSEIWLVDYMKGQETMIASDVERSYSNPALSPDGQWILCQGNAKSNISKKMNLDIFAIRVDGTQTIQLTYHPAYDCCPVWSPDGKYIYFLSTRATKKNAYNVWRMNFL